MKESLSIIKWQYFLYNHGDAKKILYEIYPLNLAEHFYNKFSYFSEKAGTTVMGWSELFMEMSSKNQKKLADWVTENYHGIDDTLKSMEIYEICKKYEGCELYQIENTDDGGKRVHIFGYMYDNEENKRQLVEFTFLYVNVAEIEHAVKNNIKVMHVIEEKESENKQYQGNISQEEFAEYVKDAKELHLSKVTKDTPEGYYINY